VGKKLVTLRIEPLPGYAPTIGRLVGMLTHVRLGLLNDIRNLSSVELDHLHDPQSNSIGALLAHAAAVERWYQVLTFEDRRPSADEESAWGPALNLGAEGRVHLRGRSLDACVADLSSTRDATLRALSARDDEWLERPLKALPEMNAHWAWFHVAEDEISHRGQIRWLRSRLGKPGGGERV
jgi:uncharacterized damage-inducible protein DinB